jgi:hypothetical protein
LREGRGEEEERGRRRRRGRGKEGEGWRRGWTCLAEKLLLLLLPAGLRSAIIFQKHKTHETVTRKRTLA